jgi:ATP/maltotriose-dependent transcriptional regulator MalT
VYRAYYREGTDRLNHALSRPEADQFPAVYTKVLVGAAALAYFIGDHERCHTLCDRALPVCREAQLHWQAAVCLILMATLSLVSGDYARAHAELSESESLAALVGDPWTRSIISSLLGLMALLSGDAQTALQLAQRGLAFANTSGEAYVAFHARYHMGNVFTAMQDIEHAQKSYREALTLCNQTGHSLGVSICMDGLSGTYAAQGALREAARLLAAAENFRKTYNLVLPKAYEIMRSQTLVAVTTHLPPHDHEAAWAEGQQLSPQDGIWLALSESSVTVEPAR